MTVPAFAAGVTVAVKAVSVPAVGVVVEVARVTTGAGFGLTVTEPDFGPDAAGAVPPVVPPVVGAGGAVAPTLAVTVEV
jgi:hypothetical protein